MIISAGLLLFRITPQRVLEVLVVADMGGPFWERKEQHAWSIPKGISEEGEEDLVGVAEREFTEEMGAAPTAGPTVGLGSIRSGAKWIHVFAREGKFDLKLFKSNEFEMEWPKGSGIVKNFPEVDRAAWVTLPDARELLVKGQVVFLDRLVEALAQNSIDFLEEPPPDLMLF